MLNNPLKNKETWNERAALLSKDVKNIIDWACERWGSFKENRNFKDTYIKTKGRHTIRKGCQENLIPGGYIENRRDREKQWVNVSGWQKKDGQEWYKDSKVNSSNKRQEVGERHDHKCPEGTQCIRE